jgi:hypothetical protein
MKIRGSYRGLCPARAQVRDLLFFCFFQIFVPIPRGMLLYFPVGVCLLYRVRYAFDVAGIRLYRSKKFSFIQSAPLLPLLICKERQRLPV